MPKALRSVAPVRTLETELSREGLEHGVRAAKSVGSDRDEVRSTVPVPNLVDLGNAPLEVWGS